MRADILLQHLNKVKSTKPGNWIACCPAHEDRGPSLAVRELDDGRILVHCFAGCGVDEILSAVGLDMTDLFPPREDGKQFSRGDRRPFPAADILRAIAHEAQLVFLCATFVHRGGTLPECDRERLLVAASRIEGALQAGGIHAN